MTAMMAVGVKIQFRGRGDVHLHGSLDEAKAATLCWHHLHRLNAVWMRPSAKVLLNCA